MCKMTDWYGKDQKPIKDRVGVYNTKFSGHEGFSYWNGRRFGNQRHTAIEAARSYKINATRGAVQEKEWRGLAQNPHAK